MIRTPKMKNLLSACPKRLLVLAIMGAAAGLLGCGPRDAGSASRSGAAAPPPVAPVLVPITNMVSIKAGTFLRIKFPVTLTRDFWLGKFEVTQGEFERVMGKNPSHFPGDPARPVEKVSHGDALAYCAAVTKLERDAGRLPAGWEYRLPTEAEWEYACRAGTTNLFSFGDDALKAEPYAWTLENGENIPHPVGQKQPNPWGLFDMHGNVWEWCLDWFEPYPAGHLTDPVGPASGTYKVFRGGGWNNEVSMARSSNRFMMAPGTGIHFVGFRVALCPSRP